MFITADYYRSVLEKRPACCVPCSCQMVTWGYTHHRVFFLILSERHGERTLPSHLYLHTVLKVLRIPRSSTLFMKCRQESHNKSVPEKDNAALGTNGSSRSSLEMALLSSSRGSTALGVLSINWSTDLRFFLETALWLSGSFQELL